MAAKRSGKKPRSQPAEFIQKPRGIVHPRVQKVGPEHFGIVSVDCAKARFKWMLADFYGNVLVPPTEVDHNRPELERAVAQLQAACQRHDIRDCLVAIERTGRYHHVSKNAFAKAGFETRTVHPFTTKKLRQPENPDVKTDDIDLAAIHRAAVNGFALLEVAPIQSWRELQLLVRHRRSLVRNNAALCCQIREHLEAAMHLQIALALEDERQRKNQEILALERTFARYLARTPYILLLSFPGINVISAADFAGEMGPIENYANARAITGRAGLFPSRYQSDRVDRANGPLVRRANRALRAAILGIADNLRHCNGHFGRLAAAWSLAGKDPRRTHVKIASRFCRIAFQMVAGRRVFRHPAMRERNYILDKLLAFHVEHHTPWAQIREDLDQSLLHIPAKEHAAEAEPLAARMRAAGTSRKSGPQPLHEILALVLIRLGAGVVTSKPSGEENLT
jgi:transposase